MKTRRTFSVEFKGKAVLSVLMGEKTASEICREHQIKEMLLSRWKQQFLAHAPPLFQQGQPNAQAETRIAELEQVIGRLTVELEIAKKALLYPYQQHQPARQSWHAQHARVLRHNRPRLHVPCFRSRPRGQRHHPGRNL